ncbi:MULTISPECIES: WD40 repeat domain-containing protein [Thermomonosporaceae]|uniref:WD40 repeat domain-containing protein n=1 Tax=Thermomonosporaceae TaxID=2012 RepID=UPI00255AAAE7|nr:MULTISPECIES: WD40 repeat domain-containing protein [Thermomonosporaceae]MDL4775819.1 WD40 repeat domain-containing protein [Actinomadura xylanilytica]
MSVSASILTSSCPFGDIWDFDLVVLDGRPLLVGTQDRHHRACTWDPARDLWTEHSLDDPWFEEKGGYTEITALGAAVVDGRILIGGGGDHQGFAQWDLETGKVRLFAQDGGVASATAADFGGRALFVFGGTSQTAVHVWEPTVAGPGEPDDPADQPFPRIFRAEIWELCARSLTGSAVAAGMVEDRRVVVAGDRRGAVLVWDIDDARPLARFDRAGEGPSDFALATVDGRPRVVAAGGSGLMLGDPDTGEWDEPLAVPGGRITCLAAGRANGRPVAVTGAEDGTVCVWDLAERRLVDRPISGHPYEVNGVGVTELEGRPVIISNCRVDAVRVWPLDL